MGALTDNRKRSSDVFSSIYPFQSSFHSLDSEFPDDFRLPPLKKPKTPSTALVARDLVPSETLRSSVTKIHSFPPPIPLRRPLHGPQRVLKSLNWRFRVAEKEETAAGMGNIWGVGHRERKSEAKCDDFGSPSTSKKDKMVIQSDLEDVNDGMSLENYKRLVNRQEDNSVVSGLRSFEASDDVLLIDKFTESPFPLSSSAVSDLTILTPKVDDHVMEVVVPDERSPVYKELYEHSKKRDPKLISLDFDIKLNEKRVYGFKKLESFFELAGKDQTKKQEQDALREPFIPLTDDEEDDVYQALWGSNRQEVLVVHESSNIEITREILQCLRPGAWLNDEVINLYLELLKERERREPNKFLRCHFFNTFFYKKLISGRGGYDFKAVRRWTTQKKIGYGLIECDKIFVPIHKEIHWCLAVINIKDNKFHYLDSLGGLDKQVLKVLARYITDEARDKSGKDVNVSSWDQEFVEDLPNQENGWDCGMFMIKYADFYSRGLRLCFKQEDMPYFRTRTAKELLRLRAD